MTTAAQTPNDLATSVLRSLMAGEAPNGIHAEECGQWSAVIEAAYAAYERGGSQAARSSIEATARVNTGVASLITGQPAKAKHVVPSLPASATEVYRHEAPCGQWLDEYVAFATEAAPMTPANFHEAAGLVALSSAVARRLALQVSRKRIFPNVYFLLLAPSTLHKKTSGMEVLQDLLHEAGLDHLLLPRHGSPEAITQEMTAHIPQTIWEWDSTIRDEWVEQRAFAAQRLWLIDEVSSLFDNMRRETYAGLLNLLLNIYECPERIVEQTIGRGRSLIQFGYLSFLGASAPSSMEAHLSNARYWTDGLWARFVILIPGQKPAWSFFQEHMPVPPSLLDGLQRIYRMFPTPRAEMVDSDDEGGRGKHKVVNVHGSGSFDSAFLAPGVFQYWEAYAKAVGFDMLNNGDIEQALHSNYGRMGTLVMKVAMLLAVADTQHPPVTVELRHLARAQRMVEGWRVTLHRLWSEGIQSEDSRVLDRILSLLAKAGPGGSVTRDIYRQLHLKPKEAREALEELQRAGQIEGQKREVNGRMVEYWRLSLPNANK